jgi:hypothetical protein
MRKLSQTLRDTWLVFLYSFGPALVPVPVLGTPKGTVDCTLEWHTAGQTYTYVFTGVVRNQGRPCPNARIQLQLSTGSKTDMIQDTVAGEDGRYELTVAVSGNPKSAADWKLVAQAPNTSTLDSTEVTGRMILTQNEDTVMVQRTIQLEG